MFLQHASFTLQVHIITTPKKHIRWNFCRKKAGNIITAIAALHDKDGMKKIA